MIQQPPFGFVLHKENKMDFKKLLEPYSENGRTVEGQIKWLTSKQILREYIDLTILKVYNELESGKTFEDGHALDRYLFDTAKAIQDSHLSKQAKELENFMNAFKDNWEQEFKNRTKLTFFQRI